jgi:hypothetical protein
VKAYAIAVLLATSAFGQVVDWQRFQIEDWERVVFDSEETCRVVK